MQQRSMHDNRPALFGSEAQIGDVDRELELLDVIRVLVSQYRLILIIFVVTVSSFLFLSEVLPERYTADVLVSPAAIDGGGAAANISGQFGGVAQLAGFNFADMGGPSPTDEAIAILKSRSFAEKVIREENLMPLLFPEAWDFRSNRWRIEPTWIQKIFRLDVEAPQIWQGVTAFQKILRINRDAETGLVSIKLTWADAETASSWANMIVKRLNVMMQADAVERANRNIATLTSELNKTTVIDTRQMLIGVLESEVRASTMARSAKDYMFKVLDPAVPPVDRSWPSRVLFLLLGAILGMVLGVMAAIWRQALHLGGSSLTTLRSRLNEIEEPLARE